MKLLSQVLLFVTPWTVAHQAPPCMEFSRQEYWSGLPFPSPGNLSEVVDISLGNLYSSFYCIQRCILHDVLCIKLKKVGKTTRPFWYDLNQIPYDYTVEVRNRFKGLNLIDRETDELWMEVHDIVQETGIKTISMEKKCEKARWSSEEALQTAVKRGEAKGKGEKEIYSHLNAEFQRRAEKNKKAFLSDQCKDVEENNRMGKTRDLFKKIRDTK